MAPTPEEGAAVPLSDPYRWVESPYLGILDDCPTRVWWLYNFRIYQHKQSLLLWSFLTIVLHQSGSWNKSSSSWSPWFRKGDTGDEQQLMKKINSKVLQSSNFCPWQSPRLKVAYNACHLATGDLLRSVLSQILECLEDRNGFLEHNAPRHHWTGLRSDPGLSWAKRSNLWLTRWHHFAKLQVIMYNVFFCRENLSRTSWCYAWYLIIWTSLNAKMDFFWTGSQGL